MNLTRHSCVNEGFNRSMQEQEFKFHYKGCRFYVTVHTCKACGYSANEVVTLPLPHRASPALVSSFTNATATTLTTYQTNHPIQ